MNQNKIIRGILIAFMLPCVSLTVYANSSWHWFTRNPLPVLPWAIVGTLIVETFIISRYNHIGSVKPAIIVIIGNLISFLVPYIFLGITPEIFEENANFFSRIESATNKYPWYTIGIVFLCLTLIVEVPVVYVSLRNKVISKKRLIVSIIMANVITTVTVAILERCIYEGSW